MKEMLRDFVAEWFKKMRTVAILSIVIVLTIGGVIAYKTIFDEPTPQLIVDDIKASFLKEPACSKNNVEVFCNYGPDPSHRVSVKISEVDKCTQILTYDECFRILIVDPYNVAYTAYIGNDTVVSSMPTQVKKFIQLSYDVSYKEPTAETIVEEQPIIEEVTLG